MLYLSSSDVFRTLEISEGNSDVFVITNWVGTGTGQVFSVLRLSILRLYFNWRYIDISLYLIQPFSISLYKCRSIEIIYLYYVFDYNRIYLDVNFPSLELISM